MVLNSTCLAPVAKVSLDITDMHLSAAESALDSRPFYGAVFCMSGCVSVVSFYLVYHQHLKTRPRKGTLSGALVWFALGDV